MAETRWITETLFDELGIRINYRAKKVLLERRTAHQHLVLFEQPFFGKMLMLDGATQIAARDEFIYQEMMAHVPLFAHGRAREVLIVGGGDCAIAEEVLKHTNVRRLVQVEIDPAVIDFAQRHFPQFTRPVFADRRFESVIDDGMKYLKRTKRCFDAIIVEFNGSDRAGKDPVQRKLLCRLPAAPEQGRGARHAKRHAHAPAARTRVECDKIPAAVCRRSLLRRGNTDLYRRPHGDGLGNRRPAAAGSLREDAGRALSPGRQLCDEILDSGRAHRGFCAAALHRRPRRKSGLPITRLCDCSIVGHALPTSHIYLKWAGVRFSPFANMH